MTTTLVNHQIRLAARPVGLPTRASWRFTSEPLPELVDGDVLV
jgi:NADPH-dependent curcumin reductase